MTLCVIFLLAASCLPKPETFDEAAWRRHVEQQEAADLYAGNFKDGRYFNPWMPMGEKHFLRFLRWRFSQKAEYTEKERTHLPEVVPGLLERISAAPSGNFIAWIGHSTYLMRLDGQYWLTDPIFSDRALLPRRLTPPALDAGDLAKLNAPIHVLISHNHYDHLDVGSIESLPEGAIIYVPSGLGEYLGSIYDGKVQEMGWWDETDAGGTRLVCLPAQHWSRRLCQPANSTLWASFMLVSSGATIYYGADSGYFVGFKEYGRRFPGIDYALLSTTAYHPRWFMHYAHKNIPETIAAFNDLGAQYLIPSQWGTFSLGDEPAGYPALDLMRHIEAQRLDPSRFIIMDIGQLHLVEHGD